MGQVDVTPGSSATAAAAASASNGTCEFVESSVRESEWAVGDIQVKAGDPPEDQPTWPPAFWPCFSHPRTLAVYSSALLLGYLIVQLLANKDCPLICREDVEDRPGVVHVYNAAELLGR